MSELYQKFLKFRRKMGLLYWDIVAQLHLALFRSKRFLTGIFFSLKGLLIRPDFRPLQHYRYAIICAHPDDETIFFSRIIKEHKPFVICMSNSGNTRRKKEFQAALEHWGVEGCMCSIPDVYKRFNGSWKGRRMIRILKKIAAQGKNLECIYTHNTRGESNHLHHQGLGASVLKAFPHCNVYMTAEVPETPDPEPNAMYLEKYEILSTIYDSQCHWLEKSCGWFRGYMSAEQFVKHQ